MSDIDRGRIEKAVREIIEALGEDPEREGLRDTPERVAEQVRHQYEAYRKPGEQDDPDISTVSRIIKVSAAYDWRVHKSGMSPLSALEELHAGAAYEFDPEVVASLRRILEARGVLRPSRVKAG